AEKKRMRVAHVGKRNSTDQAVRSWPIFDIDRLFPTLSEALGVKARQDIGQAPRADLHDHADRPLRPRFGNARHRQGEVAQYDADYNRAHSLFHAVHGVLHGRSGLTTIARVLDRAINGIIDLLPTR